MLSIVIHQGEKSDQELKTEVRRQELKQRPQRNAASWLIQAVFYTTQVTCPGVALTPESWTSHINH